jgi:S-layer protein
LTVSAEETSITGGSGADTIIMGGTLTYEDTVDGGDGVDTLSLSTANGTVLSNAATGNVKNVSNIETLKLSAQLDDATAIDMSQVTGLKNLTIVDFGDAGSTSDHVTVTNALDGLTITVGDATADTLVTDLIVNFAANSASNDMTLALTNVTTPDLVNTDGYADGLTITATGTNAIDISTYAADSVTVSGSGSLDLTSGALNATTSSIDASGLTGAFKVTASDTSTEITGGAGGDTLTGAAGADVISGGAGTDTITGGGGIDTLTGGAGVDTFVYADDEHGNVAEKIMDFVAGASGDKFQIDNDIEASNSVGVSTTSEAVQAVDTSNVGTISFETINKVLLFTGESYTSTSDLLTHIDAEILEASATDLDGEDAIIVFHDSTGSDAGVYLATLVGDANWSANGAAAIDIQAKLEGYGLADIANLTAANFDIIG